MSSTGNIRRSFFELMVRILFVVVPTMAVSAYVLNTINLSYTGFNSGTFAQFLWLFAGIVTAYIFSWLRGRFLVFSLIVLLGLWIAKAVVSNLSGEFDVFYAQAKYWLFATLFTIGWLAGFLVNRSRLFVVMWCAVLTLIYIVFLTRAENTKMTDFGGYLLPVFVYSIYMIYLVPRILSTGEWNVRKSVRWVWTTLLVIVLAWGAFAWLSWYKMPEIEATQAQMENKDDDEDKKNGSDGTEGYDERNGLMEHGREPEGEKDNENKRGGGNKDGDDKGNEGDKGDDKQGGDQDGKGNEGDEGDKDGGDKGGDQPQGGRDKKNATKDDKGKGEGGLKMKDSMKMGEKQSSSDILMFCARLENYFPNGQPQPLYFVYHYLTKYDPKTETFVRDPMMPQSDELRIDPSQVDMYRTKTDSTPIKNSLATKKRKTVEADVFISASVWKHSLLAPSAPYSVQTIPVDSGYKDLFRSGYHVKSYTSELNNAYFVYNPSANPMILQYQQERVNELQSVKDYKSVDSLYYAYYTTLPQGTLFDSIRNLALRITATAKTPVEKVVAIRDYFLQKKSDGTALYRYTLDPGAKGDPNIPTGGMLRNFLFRSHEGYCTYFAGASVLMLQSIGVPARFATGFATIDRSDKNKGWYWFYASQAHAWTQVYFPEYGWLDFDMTIGNEDEGGIGDAPKPDGTPPVPPPQPWLIIEGIVTEEPEKGSGKLNIRFDDLIFFNDEYHLDTEREEDVDATLCRFVYADIDTTFDAIHKGDTIFVVSWDDMAKDVPEPDLNKSIEEQMKDFPWPVIADEIYIQKKLPPKKEEDKKKAEEEKQQTVTDWTMVWYILAAICAVALITIVFFPLLYLARLRLRVWRAGTTRNRAEAVYRSALYTYHMSGEELKAQTALSYAEERVDPRFGTSFAAFVNAYLRLKYSGLPERDEDRTITDNFNAAFRKQVTGKLKGVRPFFRWFNLMRALRYFRTPEALTENVNRPYGE